jgi:hypothetical protein
MDYAGANANSLYKYQWDYIHNPQKMIGLLQDDEEGEYRDQTDLLLTTIYNQILVKNNLFHLSDIWDNESFIDLLKKLKPYLVQSFFVKEENNGYKIDKERYYKYIGLNNESEFTQEKYNSLTDEQIIKYELALTLTSKFNNILYSFKTNEKGKIKIIKRKFYIERKKESENKPIRYTWIDGRMHDYMDPRTYYKDGNYNEEKLQNDIKELILLMNSDWVTSLTHEKRLKREQRYFTLKSMFSEFMYNTGVYEISSISSSTAAELAEQIRLNYYEEEAAQYDVLWSLITIEKEKAEQIRLALEQRLAEDAVLKAFLEKQKGKAIRTMVVGGAGVITGVVIIVFFPPSAPGIVAGISTAVKAADIGFSLGTFIEGASMYHAITNDNFDRNKDYKLFRGIAVEMFGDGGARFYDLASVIVSIASVTDNVTTIYDLTKLSGKELEIIIRGINSGASSVSSVETGRTYFFKK